MMSFPLFFFFISGRGCYESTIQTGSAPHLYRRPGSNLTGVPPQLCRQQIPCSYFQGGETDSHEYTEHSGMGWAHTPVLRVRVIEMWGPSLTICGQLLRKSSVHWQNWHPEAKIQHFCDELAGNDRAESKAVMLNKHSDMFSLLL